MLISPYIKPGTVSKRFYNHYSWLRTMEDLFDVSSASRGLDRQGHLGYAAQRGLAPFGSDVFNNARGKPIHPRISFTTDRVVQASAAQPRLAVQGDSVSVATGHGQVLATAVGPSVPPPDPAAGPTSTTCTFKVTLVARSGAVPLSPGAFTIIDEQGRLHRPSVSVSGSSAASGQVVPGRPVTLSVRSVLPIGGGRLSWAPDGSKPLVSWDFDVELD